MLNLIPAGATLPTGILVHNMTNGNNTDFTHVFPTGMSNTALIVIVGTHQGNITGITYNGDAMTKIAEGSSAFDEDGSVWILLNPDTGSNTVDISRSGGSWHGAVALSLSNVKQTTTITNVSEGGNESTPDINITPSTNDNLIITGLGAEAYTYTDDPQIGLAQISGASYESMSGSIYLQGTAAAFNSQTYLASGQRYGLAVVALEPAPAATTANSERSATIRGKDTANAERSATMLGKVATSSERSATILGTDTANSERGAVATGKVLDDDERAARLHGTAEVTDERSAVVTGKQTDDDERGATLLGKTTANAERAAKTLGKVATDDERGGHITGKQTADSERSATIEGTTASNDQRSATILGQDSANSERGGHITGKTTANDERAATMLGQDSTSSERSGIITGKDSAASERNAVITGKDTDDDERGAILIGTLDTAAEIAAHLWGKILIADERGATMLGKSTASSERWATITGKVNRGRPTILPGLGVTVLGSVEHSTPIPGRTPTIL
jgi:hypothetical protein